MRIAVVGAGSIGLAVAWRAAQAGAEVVVHDPEPGSGASRVAAGMIAPVTESHYGEEALAPFMAESADAWPAFARELERASGMEVGFRDVPTLVVGVGDGDRAEIDRQVELYRCTARNVEVLTARAARKLEPLLSHRVRGGVLAPEDRAVDPRAVHEALLVAVERAGGELRRERVDDLGLLDADQVVIAAGCGSARFTGGAARGTAGERGVGSGGRGDGAQWSLPVRPVRGAVLRLRAAGDQPMPRTTVRGYVKGQPVYIVTRGNGEVVVGATSDERGFDQLTGTAGAVHDLLRRSMELVPEIAEYHLEEVSVGFRPGTPDNLPLIGRIDERTVAATGHYRNGIALIPATADAVAALVLGEGEGPPKAFDPLRFRGNGDRGAGRFEGMTPRPGTSFAGAPESIVPTGTDNPDPSGSVNPSDPGDMGLNGGASASKVTVDRAEPGGSTECGAPRLADSSESAGRNAPPALDPDGPSGPGSPPTNRALEADS